MSRVFNAVAPIALIGVFIAVLVALAGAADAQTGNARLRVLHASPDAPNVDVYVDGAEAISNLAFGSITDYTSVPAGAHAVKVFPTSANGTGTPVIDVPSVTLDAGKDYTVAAANVVASIEPVVLVDNNAAPAAGKAHVRVVHASPGAPNVDIFAEGAGVVVPNLPFKQASEYLPLAAGSYNLQVRVAGTTTAVVNLPGTRSRSRKSLHSFRDRPRRGPAGSFREADHGRGLPGRNRNSRTRRHDGAYRRAAALSGASGRGRRSSSWRGRLAPLGRWRFGVLSCRGSHSLTRSPSRKVSQLVTTA